jgi:2-polyprenyl-3-methyl-5-hydroxy-6-metoxy-1,4-benzoquinol methylase
MTAQEQVQTRDAWDDIAAGYDEFVTPTHMWLANEGLRRAGLRSGMRFLDVAAGSGALSLPAARLGAQVLAVDLSPNMLERLKARARKEGLNLQTRVMDGHALELEENASIFPDRSLASCSFRTCRAELARWRVSPSPGGVC